MDTQIGLLGGKYSLALDDGAAFNSYNLMLTNLLLYLTNVNSHDFFIHFDTSFSPSAKLKMSREKSVSREKPLHGYRARLFPERYLL
jgi:hypothetical protein